MKCESTNIHKYGKIIFWLLGAVLVVVDQTVKYIIRTSGGFYICNKNFAFGLSLNYILLIFVSILIVVLAWQNFNKSKIKSLNVKSNQKPKCQKLLILGLICHFNFGIWFLSVGAVSNIIDRIYHGCVIDFIDFGFWPVFNLADVCITIGAILIAIRIIRK